MTEDDWNSCTEKPEKMLECLRDSGKASDRKLRLFTCACCRRVWDLVPDPRSRKAVETSEQYADGSVGWWRVYWRGNGAWGAVTAPRDRWTLPPYAALAAAQSRRWMIEAMTRVVLMAAPAEDCAAYCTLLREVFGNPFRPVTIDPAWLTRNDGSVKRLAQAAYEERSLPSGHLGNARLCVLADALEEAGATEAVFAHLRQPGSHVRGCHIVDALLGKG